MAKTPLRLVTPAAKKRADGPARRPNSELRSREHLTQTEVEKLIEAARGNRYGHRDATMILVAYRHGLRASEVCDLRWEQVDWNSATLHVRRVKSGKPSTHPIRGDELRALRKLQREAPKSPFVFVSERSGPFTTDSFNWMIKRAGQKAGLPFQVHAHMLRLNRCLSSDADLVFTISLKAIAIENDVRGTESSLHRYDRKNGSADKGLRQARRLASARWAQHAHRPHHPPHRCRCAEASL